MSNEKSYSIFLDDERDPPDNGVNWMVARSYNRFVSAITVIGQPDFISFDHDLGDDEEGTGYDCAMYLLRRGIKPKNGYQVHSMNPVGAERIRQCMEGVMILDDF